MSGLSIDDALGTDEERLIAEMDRVRPSWWLDFADDRDVRSVARSLQEEVGQPATQVRLVAGQKRRTLRRVKDALWVVGHSALQVAGEGGERRLAADLSASTVTDVMETYGKGVDK